MANDIYNYSVMTNTGKGFITNDDSRAFWIGGQPSFQTLTEEWDAGQNVKVIDD